MSAPVWHQADAIALCRAVEAIAPNYGYHVALTGGLLYKDGPRKDCDLVLYRIRQEYPDREPLLSALGEIGLKAGRNCGFVHKASYHGRSVDLLFPDFEQDGDYGDRDDEVVF